MNYFNGKAAIVTGGASGIGRSLCHELARRGAVVVVADVNGEGATKVASEIGVEIGGRVFGRALDVTDAAKVKALVDEVSAEHGHLDFMFNNAGVSVAGDARDLTLEHWRRVLDVNLWGVIHGTDAAYRVMVRQGFGHIVNTSSLSGLIPFPTNLPYCTTKHAVVGLSQSLRAEGADLGVRVSVVCPGYVQSNIFQSTEMVGISGEAKARVIASNPFGYMDTNKAAKAILDGVARNQAVIVFPGWAKAFWLLYRLNASLLGGTGLRTIRDFRASRSPEGAK